MAEFRIDRLKFRWEGNWVVGRKYIKDDVVKYDGKAYVCLQKHIANSNFYVDTGLVSQTVTYTVTVGQDNINGESHGVFYINGEENPQLLLVKGNTYIFNQDNLTNKTFNNQIHPLLFSNVLDGTVAGGQDFTVGVSYLLNNSPVTRQAYLANFSNANFRQIQITLTDESTTSRLFYYSSINSGMGNRLETAYSSNWELMFDGREWFGEWRPNKFYPLDGIVKFKGYIYKCAVPHLSTTVDGQDLSTDIANWTFYSFGNNWLDIWQTDTVYSLGDVVRYYGNTYICVTAHTSEETESDGLELSQANWLQIARSDNWRNIWLANTRYTQDDVISYGGVVYRCIQSHTSAIFNTDGLEVDQLNWEVVHSGVEYKGEWAPGIRYKLNDVIKRSAGLWKAAVGHVSGINFRADESNWTVYVPGLGYEEVWDSFVEYSRGDIVLYGGYSYVALENNLNSIPSVNGILQDTGNWELLTIGYKNRNAWDTVNFYKTGEIVTLNGYLYIAVTDNAASNPDTVTAAWQLLVPGSFWKGDWADETTYFIGDVVTVAGTAYVCVDRHSSSTLNSKPNLDVTFIYWNLLIQGAPNNVLTNLGDIKTFDTVNQRLAIGNSGNVLKILSSAPTWLSFNEVPKTYYVSTDGTDSPEFGTTLASPFRTVKYACDYILADEANRAPATVLIKTGYYQEILPIRVPANVALVGDELRSTNISPTIGFEQSNMFYVRNGSGIRNMTLEGLNGTLQTPNEYLTRRPSAGAFVSLDPGSGPADETTWITSKSPYIQNVSAFGTGCIGMKIDGALHDQGNRSIVANDFTQIISDGIGYWATNLGRSELVSVFTYFCHIGYLATDGGILRATNGNNSYGTYGSVAEGVDQTEIPITATVDNQTSQALVDQIITFGTTQQQIIAVGYRHAGQEYSTAAIAFGGSGINAAGVINEFRNSALSHIRVDAAEDSSPVGGLGYQFVSNTAQSGTNTSIVIAAADVGTAEKYVGMRIVVLSGRGVGQYATITAFDEVTKTVTIEKPSNGSQGWEHLQPGWPIESILDETTRYAIEPAVSITTPLVITSAVTAPAAHDWKYIVHSGSRYVSISSGSSGTAYSTTSVDGNTWSSVESLGPRVLNGLIYSGSHFLAVISTVSGTPSDAILRTSNGSAWEFVVLPSERTWKAISTDQTGTVLIVAVDGTTATSTTNGSGSSWIAGSIATTIEEWSVSAYGNGQWVVLNNTTGDIAYSADRISWTKVTAFAQPIVWSEIVYGNGRFVAISSTGNTVGRSFDGKTWILSSIAAGTFSRVSYGGGVFVATGSGNLIATSHGADVWKTVGSDSSAYLTTVSATWQGSTYNNGTWIVVSESAVWNSIQTGATPVVRASVLNNRINKFIIYDTGSHLTNQTISVFDPQATVPVVPTLNINNGVLTQPQMSNRGEGYVTATATISGNGYAELYQVGKFLRVKDLSRLPGPGDNLSIGGIENVQYSITETTDITGSGPYSARFTLTPFLGVEESPNHNESIQIRQRYSQVRLTGHDFLDIGTGNVSTTRYPDLYLEGETPINERQPFNETVANGGGRVFYTSTDQDGNFRVGELFQVEQSRGVVTISASQFDLSGLTELSLGGIQVGGSAVVIREFSTDPTFIAESNNVVSTQRAIRRFLESRITGGSSNAQTNALVAGQIQLTGNNISILSDLPIVFPTVVNFQGGFSGTLLAAQYLSLGTNTLFE